MSKVILISACLKGFACRYNGDSFLLPELETVLSDCQVFPCCPELMGGLAIPRPPAEIRGGDGRKVIAGEAKVVNQLGGECTGEFLKGAYATLKLCEEIKPEVVLFKAHSPSCGVGRIYDGSFRGRFISGDGVTTALLRETGVQICTEEDFLLKVRANH